MNALKMRVFAGMALLCAGATLAGCNGSPELTSSDAQKLIQAKYDSDPPVAMIIKVDDLGMRQGVTAKYWDRSKSYPIKYWADFKLTADGKKAVALPGGGDTIEWHPDNADDKNYAVTVNSAANGHLKAKDVQDPQNESDGTKTVKFNEAYSLDGVPAPLQDIAHNPGNKLSSHKTATFVLDGGAWKLQSIT